MKILNNLKNTNLRSALRWSASAMLVILVWVAFFGMIAFAVGLAIVGARHGAAGHPFTK